MFPNSYDTPKSFSIVQKSEEMKRRKRNHLANFSNELLSELISEEWKLIIISVWD